ncbi:hypothetical protein ACFVUY_24720 [Kitasatospora sp. NPDC058063]|uniref:hypothetical protein n=1 Tax=unclassified Kitasatospora TaxID=2633591 RepID=UPI0036DCCF89
MIIMSSDHAAYNTAGHIAAAITHQVVSPLVFASVQVNLPEHRRRDSNAIFEPSGMAVALSARVVSERVSVPSSAGFSDEPGGGLDGGRIGQRRASLGASRLVTSEMASAEGLNAASPERA